MPEKTVREMSELEKRRYSLETRMFHTTLLGSVLVGLVAFVVGLGLYTVSLVDQYAVESFSLARSTAMVIDSVADVEPLADSVMKIYKELPETEHLKTGTYGYREHFSYLSRTEEYEYLRSVLAAFLESSDVSDLYIGMYDADSEALIYFVDPDTDPTTQRMTGDWDPIEKKELDTFLKWNGGGRLYDVSNSRYYSWMCTAGYPLRNADGETYAFILSDVTLSEVADGMKAFALRFILAIALVQIVYAVLITLRMKKTVVKPINEIAEAAQAYVADKRAGVNRNDHFEMLNIRTGDQIENLAFVMSEMEHDMAEYVDDLTSVTAEKARIGTELGMAAQIQAAMLPHIFPPYPEREEFDIFASMEPAKEVGGDFYDFFLVDDDHLALVMADVSGKGVPASLFMMASKCILQSCAMLNLTADDVLRKTNQALCSNNQMDMFVTCWLGMLEISTGKLAAVSAGHEYPAIKGPDGKFALFKDKHGFPLGGFDDEEYESYEIQLEPGSKLFVYTDGVPEAMDAERNQFGTGRMIDALNSDTEGTPEQLLSDVRSAVKDFVKDAEQFDDITMLCIEYKGPSPK